RLAKRCAQASMSLAGGSFFRNRGQVHVVNRAQIAEQVENRNPRQAHTITRSAFHLGLVLLPQFPGKHLVFVFQLADSSLVRALCPGAMVWRGRRSIRLPRRRDIVAVRLSALCGAGLGGSRPPSLQLSPQRLCLSPVLLRLFVYLGYR